MFWGKYLQRIGNKIIGPFISLFMIHPSRTKLYHISEITKYTFPYLDLDFLWNDEDKYEFQVHWKANPKLK